ncbi:cyclopropane-fatty-acyl-phospholipid synthase [Thiohalobacter thiocyanaticus]|uniref:Cyclopropane-fatty-acyl-phospholipid synthase n=1 Tax=Thiohalobacter thiocyanaticus TaxID=585455 RepID=A0A1Z4VRT0_9GAMM|nr:cyclopropane-fatty-acyl-phospholipid synthase family protein [Thiohalobacter thiocyanaticus]BAZ94122.1 cyclopropane-fatty-acyl-phospholipid synthase [Thiohalobacter thiocyanaticus]
MTTEKVLRLEPQLQQLPVALRLLLPLLRAIRIGSLRLELADGRRFDFIGEQEGPAGVMRLQRPARFSLRLIANAGMGLAQAYLRGDWSSTRLADTLQVLALNERHMRAAFPGRQTLAGLDRLQHRLRANTRRGSRRNIRRHYDLGNDFYRLWLDPGMTYSGARFARPDEALEAAQTRKYAELLDSLHAAPGDHILEIGCGWGGFVEYAGRRGHRVTGITLSPAQYEYARARIAAAGLNTRVELRLQDYRDVRGRFDHVVSIEMFEAVGTEYWPDFFTSVFNCLRPGGRAALQVITIDPAVFARYVRRADFIQKYIFPGGMLPSVPVFAAHAARAGFQISRCEFRGEDYARTLRHWDHRFMLNRNRVREQGFDDRFVRLWHYYLAYCEAGFMTGRIDLMQTTLIRPPCP